MSQHDSVTRGDRYRAPRFAHGIGVLGLFLLAACSDSTDNLLAPAQRPLPRPLAALGASSDSIPGQYIVTFRNDVSDARSLAKQIVSQVGGRLGFTYTSAIKGFSAQLPDQAIAALQRNPQIERIEVDRRAVASDVQNNPGSWGIDRIDQRTLPLDASYSYANSGDGVSVYILDTGIRTTHTEFGGRAVGAFTAISDGNGTGDCSGHGTHVAGTVGGTRYGVAKAVKLYSVRVLDCTGYGSYSGIIAGVDWVTKNRVVPAVANMSLSGGVSSTLSAAIQSSINAGVVYTVAAGNNSADACNFSPGNTPQALTVGASGNNDSMSGFSNYGPCVDIFAPGNAIRAAYYVDDTSSVLKAGTSMSSPHVAGVAALYLAANPGASPAEVSAAIISSATPNVLTGLPAQTANLLVFSGVTGNVTPPADTTVTPPTSSPIDSVTPVAPTPTDASPIASFTASCPHGKCVFDASGSTDDTGIVTYAWNFGDGTAMSSGTSLVKASHTYTAAGKYTVTLTVRDAASHEATKSLVLSFKKL